MTEIAFAARCLLRVARQATLATTDDGQPFASLVTPATTPDGDVLLLLSALSAHTRHLAAEPRCALLGCGAADGANPQTAPRLTVVGRAARDPDPGLRRAWLARHPYAAEYADFTDFAVWRLTVEAGHYVGGFARAHALGRQALLPPQDAVEAIRAAEPRILAHCNADHAQALAEIARHLGGRPEAGGWQMVAADMDGIDLASGEAVVRIAFDRPVASPAELRSAMVRLVEHARERTSIEERRPDRYQSGNAPPWPG